MLGQQLLPLFLALQLALQIDVWQCTCEQLMTEYDCMTQYKNRFRSGEVDSSQVCFWYQEKCQNMMNYLPDISCSSLTNEECSLETTNTYTHNPVCVWYNNAGGGVCSKFTRCQDYTYTSEGLALVECANIGCSTNGTKCSFDYRGRQDQLCSQLTDQKTCDSTFIKDKFMICQWNSVQQKCSGQIFELCSDLLKQAQCDMAKTFCAWKGNSCNERVCADREYEYESSTSLCISFYSLTNKLYTQCKLDTNGDCIEVDPSAQPQYRCNFESRFTYYWNTTSDSCYPCLFISQQLILYFGIITLLLIF